MSYFQITAKVEEVNESSYTVQSTGEVVTKVQLSLVVPTLRERVLVEMAQADAPKTDTLDRWEMEESWVTVSADGMRAIGFARSNARAGEKAVGALVVFQAHEIREASAEERKQLQQARKAQKLQAKQRRAARQAERQAERQAQTTQATAQTVKQSA